MSTTIRKSTKDDEGIIRSLIELCFGERSELGVYENLDGRYLLLFEEEVLVALSGLSYESEFEHLKVGYTCTHPNYRNRGYMQELFKFMLKDVNDLVYCSCWRFPPKERVNLYSIMTMFGFKEVIKTREHWKVPHNCSRTFAKGCVQCTGEDCECFEDLWVREIL